MPTSQPTPPSDTGPILPRAVPPGDGSAAVVLRKPITARLSSGVMVLSPKTGIDCGPVSIASYMCFGVVFFSEGAYLPRVSAPPDPA